MYREAAAERQQVASAGRSAEAFALRLYEIEDGETIAMTNVKMMLAGGAVAAALAIAAACGGSSSSNTTGPRGGCPPRTTPQTNVILKKHGCPPTHTLPPGRHAS